MISVCIATYNGAAYIREQIQSILPQLGKDDEIVVSDDGSTDETLMIIKAIHDERIIVLPPHEQLGSTRNFYNAIDSAKGDIIFLADQDDIWLPGRVKRCLKELGTADMVVTDSQVVDEHLQLVYPSLFQLYDLHAGFWHNLMHCGFYGSMMAMRKEIVDKARPWPENELIKHDWWLGMVAEKMGRVRFVADQQYMLYRRHDGTETVVSNNLLKRSKRSLKVKLMARIEMLNEISKK